MRRLANDIAVVDLLTGSWTGSHSEVLDSINCPLMNRGTRGIEDEENQRFLKVNIETLKIIAKCLTIRGF